MLKTSLEEIRERMPAPSHLCVQLKMFFIFFLYCVIIFSLSTVLTLSIQKYCQPFLTPKCNLLAQRFYHQATERSIFLLLFLMKKD